MELLVKGDGRGRVLIQRKQGRSAQFAPPHAEEEHALLCRALLHYQRVKLTQVARQFGFLAQHSVDLLDLGMDLRRLFEFERFRGPGALLRERTEQRLALRIQKFHDPPHFTLVFVIGATAKAGRKTHLHLRVYATGVGRVGVQILDAAANLEEVEKFRRKTLGGSLRRKRAVVVSPVFQQAPSGIAAREAVTQVELEKGRRFRA